MLSLSQQEFVKLAAAGYSHIPLMQDILADLDTPLSAYLKLANSPYTYLLESVQGGEKWGRYSIIGLPCEQHIEISGQRVRVFEHAQDKQACLLDQEVDNPLDWLENFQKQFYTPELTRLEANKQLEIPRFLGGLVGYFGYETIRYIEPRLSTIKNNDPLQTPDILLLISQELIVFDNVSGKLYLVVHARLDGQQDPLHAWETARARLKVLSEKLASTPATQDLSDPVKSKAVKEADFVSGFTQTAYEQAVDRIKQYITDGDAMQVVLSQRMQIPYHARPLDCYRALRSINPSPYMYYFDLGDFHIVGASPEILTRVEHQTITVRPIAGTRPRGQTTRDDQEHERSLLADPKELAEHLMLIDLGRNDIGRVCETGTVKLTEKMIIERYAHVMHIVSNVEGRLKSGTSVIDALKATFPAGTVSGAPKIRAMEIIDELEPVKRGIYSGAVGYFSWSGNLDTAIAIRTAIIKDNTLYIQAGAGIVADSVPRNEWDETMNKGRSVFKAVALAQCGLTDCSGED